MKLISWLFPVLALSSCSEPSVTPPAPASTSTSVSTGTGGAGGAMPENFAVTEACTVSPQAGCPEGHTCLVVTLAGATTCEKAGSAPEGASCKQDAECAPGLTCAGLMCRPFCRASSDCHGKARACQQMYTDNQVITGDSVCSPPCNPADPQNTAGAPSFVACPAGRGCFTLDATVGPQGSTDCFSTGTVAKGGSCTGAFDCAPGLVCLNLGTTASCTRSCLMGITACACLSFAKPRYAATANAIVELGYCE